VPAGHELRPPDGESVAHIEAARGGAELGLGGGGHAPREHVGAGREPPRSGEAAREEPGLVEAALALPPRVERHRHHHVHRREGERRPELGEQVAERGGKRAAAAELEGV
jgi:hypothetical protein